MQNRCFEIVPKRSQAQVCAVPCRLACWAAANQGLGTLSSDTPKRGWGVGHGANDIRCPGYNGDDADADGLIAKFALMREQELLRWRGRKRGEVAEQTTERERLRPGCA